MAKRPTQETRRLYNTRFQNKHPKRIMLNNAKARAARKGLPFDLTEDDFHIPEVCPVLGLVLEPGDLDRAPTLDRLVPALGYVAGNVAVISALSNRVKSNATATEIMKVALWVTRETPWEPEPADAADALDEFAREARDFSEIFALITQPAGRI